MYPLQDRIAVWYDQTQRYSSEYREFKNQILSLVESLDKEKEEQRSNLEIATSRIERLERELDYLENKNPVPTCLEMEEKLIDQTAERTQEKKKRKHKVAGKMCDSNLEIGDHSYLIVKGLIAT